MKKGFTLIEIIVALGIFSIVALVSVSSLLAMTNAQKKARAIQASVDNLRFAVEVMSKNIRTGRLYFCDSFIPTIPFTARDCTSGNSTITFIDALGDVISYKYDLADGQVDRFIGGTNPVPITAEELVVEMSFFVTGSNLGDDKQPLITIVMKGAAGTGRARSTFNIQTTVTQRRVEFSS